MKMKWFVTSAVAILVVGLVAGCSEERKTPTAPVTPPPEGIPFEEGGVTGKTYSGSHDYGRAGLDEHASRPRVERLLSELRDLGYEQSWDRSILIEGNANGTDASIGYLVARSVSSENEWAIVTVIGSKEFYAFDAAFYWSSPPPSNRGATEVEPGLWTAPIETVIGPSAERWSSGATS